MHCEIGGTKGPLGYVSALGATRLVHWLILVAPSCLRSHNARYIMLKSLRGTAPSSHWRISAPHTPTYQFTSTNPVTKHTLHTYLNARHEDTWHRHLNSATILLLSFGMSPWINPIAPIQPLSHAPIARPHKSIPSPWSSRAPPWGIPINQSNRPDPARAARPHGTPP